MVKIRLTRMGRHKQAFYRIVATDSRNKVNGGYIELLGQLDPYTDKLVLKEEAILLQLSLGAQPSDRVKQILKNNGIWAKHLSTKKPKGKKVIKEKKVTVAKKTTATVTKKTVAKKTSNK